MTSTLLPRRHLAAARAVAETLGQGKSFRDNPILGNHPLNRLGLHVARVVAAQAATHLRWQQLRWLVPAGERATFHRDGVVVIPDILDADIFAALRHELAGYRGAAREMRQGTTLTQRVLLDRRTARALPRSQHVARSPRLQRWLRYAQARDQAPLLYVQQIVHGRAGRPDPQQSLHADTFFPTMKAWLFLHDVGEDDGPFVYVRGSHRLTEARARWEYGQSLVAGVGDNRYAARGSLRVGQDDLAAMKLPAPEPITARANTLVVANTHGFHARGRAPAGASRLELFAYGRPNPFVPLAHLTVPGYERLQSEVLRRWWAREDERARAARRSPTWRRVPAIEFAVDGASPTPSRRDRSLL